MLSLDVKILNVTGLKVWRWQLRPTLNFMQLIPGFSSLVSLPGAKPDRCACKRKAFCVKNMML